MYSLKNTWNFSGYLVTFRDGEKDGERMERRLSVLISCTPTLDF